jgi:DNA-binding response OmpR family regulator
MDPAAPLVAVVDDEENMRVALRRLLRLHGFRVETFATGGALIHDARVRGFHAVVLDLHMPGMDGFEVLETLSADPAGPPVVVITGRDDEGNAAKAREWGAVAYFVKPVEAAALVEILRRPPARGMACNHRSIPAAGADG